VSQSAIRFCSLLGPLKAAVDPFLPPDGVVLGLVEVLEHIQVLVDGHQGRPQLMRDERNELPLEERGAPLHSAANSTASRRRSSPRL